MKTISVMMLFFLIFPISGYSQESYEYSNSELFAGEAVVFTQKFKQPIQLPKDAEVFTPSQEDIITAEYILSLRYNKDVAGAEKRDNTKKRYWRYNRQYLGFIDASGEKHILINLLNFKHKKKAAKQFEGWRHTFFIGFGEYYEKNSIRLSANLTKQRLSLF
jgi:hypothetical protein